jgi:hypothetical protein
MDKEKDMIEKQHTTVALEETAVQELVSRMRGELLMSRLIGSTMA